MIKLIVFDLDGTLAELGKGILPENIERLKKLEEGGATIAVCSGKPVYYLCGFMRQVGLKYPILVGENGAVIQFGVDLPPKQYYVLPYSDEAKRTINFLKNKIIERFPDMWFQPNEVGLTPFPKNDLEFEAISSILEEHKDSVKDVTVYRHADSFDITPNGIDKKAGLQYLGEILDILPEETVVVGDGVNDYPMFEYAGYSVGINVKDDHKVDRNFAAIDEACSEIGKLIFPNIKNITHS